MKAFRWILTALAVLSLQGCMVGWIYRKHTEPRFIGQGKNEKVGRACMRSYLGLVTVGDASIRAAREAGQITKIASVDREYTAIIYYIVYRRYCVVVSGE